MNKVLTGLDQISDINASQYPGNIALLCHSASINSKYEHAIDIFKAKFSDRFTKIFSPQHGLVGDVQDNMVETDHYQHPYYQMPIYSLYSETRSPTAKMLENIDIVFIDLQDVGTRIYTYIYTMTLMMKACQEHNIKIVVLDRPNPIGGLQIEGNILKDKFKSFVGLHPLPARHALTIAEVALMNNKYWQKECELEIISMKNWKRSMYFEDTGLPWVLPSPNLATPHAAISFVGTVLFEGTNISEGRGTTRSLDFFGHPNIEPLSFLEKIEPKISHLKGFVLRPISFIPTFQKHAGKNCGGYQIHVTEKEMFKPWELTQILCREFYHHLGSAFKWKDTPYEYEYDKNPVDLINGTDQLRNWYVNNGGLVKLYEIENLGREDYLKHIDTVKIYS